MGLFDSLKHMRLFGQRSQSGKTPGNTTYSGKNAKDIFDREKVTEVDYTENNYDLFRAIYHNSIVNGFGKEYLVAAALGKPVINTAASYVAGRGFNIELDNPNNNPLIEHAEEEINTWLDSNRRTIYSLAKHAYRDGDAYLHIDEFGRLTELDAKGVTEIVDPVTGSTIGFDVKRTVTIVDSADLINQKETEYVYVKQYRTDSIRIYRYKADSQESTVEVLFEKVYTVNGAVDIPKDEEGKLLGLSRSEIQERRLAILAFHNEPESEAVYGNSDYQNLLVLINRYSTLIGKATRGAGYNAIPTPVIIGLSDAAKTRAEAEYVSNDGRHLSPAAASLDSETQAMYQDNGKSSKQGIEWGEDKVLYLSKGSDAKFITGNGFMDDLGKLLEFYFYLFVQGSETPEFLLGTAVSSSKASTETQSPVFDKKIERKQLELATFIENIVLTMIERKALMSDPMYMEIKTIAPAVRVVFPSLTDEDMAILFSTVQWAFESGLITSKRVLQLLLSDKIKDIPEELLNASEEAKRRAEEEPANSDRIVRDLFKQAKFEQEQPEEV